MSYPPPPPGPNPYESPVAPPMATYFAPPASQMQMQYLRAYNYIFENPDWLKTVLFMGILFIPAMIPGVGIVIQLFYLGYQFEVIDWLLKSQGRQYPNFDFSRMGDYLGRGIWPFLVNMVGSFVLLPVIYIGMFVGMLVLGGISSAAGDDAGPVIAGVLGILMFLGIFAALFLAGFIMVAMLLRAGLTQDFASAFQLAWIKDFCRKMWREMLLSGLFMMVTGFALEILGIMALCVGLFFVIPLFLLATSHILYQLYVVYLSKGGIPIPLKVTPQSMANPSTMPSA